MRHRRIGEGQRRQQEHDLDAAYVSCAVVPGRDVDVNPGGGLGQILSQGGGRQGDDDRRDPQGSDGSNQVLGTCVQHRRYDVP